MCGDAPWPGSAKTYTPSIQLTKEQSSHKNLFSLSISVMELSVFHHKADQLGKVCHHGLGHVFSLPVGERTRGWLAAESFSLPHLALLHSSCVGGILKISLAKGHEEPLQVWPEQFAQDDHCILQAELKYWSEANLSVFLSFAVFHQELCAAGEPSKELGQPLEWSRIA